MPPGVRPQVLNNAFQEAANQARQKLPELTSNQKVRSASFNWLSDWIRDFLSDIPEYTRMEINMLIDS